MTTQSRKSQEKEFEKMIAKTGGKVFIAITHQTLYGPLRGLNFVLKEAKAKQVFDFIESSFKEMTMEEMEALLKKVKAEGPDPKNLQHTLAKVWMETGLSVIPQIIPFEMVEQAENPPEEVISLEEGLKKVNQSLYLTSKLQAKDPFFFRTGII